VLRPEFVERKLQLITEDLGRLTGFRGVGYEELVEDDVDRRIVHAAIGTALEQYTAYVEQDETTMAIMLKSTLFTLLALAMHVQPASGQIQGMERRAGAEHRQRCETAADALADRHTLPLAAAREALKNLRRCEISAVPAFARAWSDRELRSAELRQLEAGSKEVHDRRIMEAVLTVAHDEAAEEDVRLAAFNVLFHYLWPRYDLKYHHWYSRPDQEIPAIVGPSLREPLWMIGADPLDEASRVRILEAFRTIESTAANPRLRRVAERLLIFNSWDERGPGGH